MRFPQLTDLWRCFSNDKPTRRRPAATRLFVEGLEQRWVPASFAAATAAELIADMNAANLTPEPDTITLAAGATFTLSAVNNTVNGPTGLPQVAAGESLTIVGNGAVIERSTAEGAFAFRLFNVEVGASLTLQDLTLQGGLAMVWAQGGAVYNQGALILESVTIQNNVAQGSAGFSGWGFAGPGGDAAGGGVYSTGTLTVDNSKILNNKAIGGRGGNGTTDDDAGGDGGDGLGGGLYAAAGTVTIHHTILTGNIAKGGSGGVSPVTSHKGDKGQGIGGGIYIDAAAWLGLDSFSLRNCKSNKAATGPNIAGVYYVNV